MDIIKLSSQVSDEKEMLNKYKTSYSCIMSKPALIANL